MKKLLLASTLILGLSLSILPHSSLADNVNVILDSSNGSSSLAVKNNSQTGVASIDSTGKAFFNSNVGIGTTNPGYSLDIIRDGANLRIRDSIESKDFILNNLGGLAGILYSGATVLETDGITTYLNGAATTSGQIGLFTNNSQRVTILGNGNVGIGTTSPGAKFDLRGTLIASSDVNSATAFQFKNAAGITVFNIDTTNRRVGIGTTTPGASLEVAGQVKITGGSPGAGKVLTSDTLGLASWQTPSSGGSGGGGWIKGGGRVTLETITDKVGIGTTNPTTSLEVNGDMKSWSLATGWITALAPVAVFGTSTSVATADAAIRGWSLSFPDAVQGVNFAGGTGVAGLSNNGYGVYGQTIDHTKAGVIGNNLSGVSADTNAGVQGESSKGTGVIGKSSVRGIYGYLNEADTAADGRSAISAWRTRASQNNGTSYQYGQTNNAIVARNYWGDIYTFGVAGYCDNDSTRTGGVLGAQTSGDYWGALGYKDESSGTYGVYGYNPSWIAVYGKSTSSTGVAGVSTSGYGGDFRSTSNIGVFASSIAAGHTDSPFKVKTFTCGDFSNGQEKTVGNIGANKKVFSMTTTNRYGFSGLDSFYETRPSDFWIHYYPATVTNGITTYNAGTVTVTNIAQTIRYEVKATIVYSD